MSTDRMSPLDSTFLHLENDVSHMHIASVGIFEGPQPPFPDIMAMIESKLALVPRYRRVVRHVPFELGRPVWVDDPHFNIEYHLRHTALPSPGGRPSYANWSVVSCPRRSIAPSRSGRSGWFKGLRRATGPCWPRPITPWLTVCPAPTCWR